MPDPAAPNPHKISMDAMLVAGASLLGVFLLMRSSSSAAAAGAGQSTAQAPLDPQALEQGILSDPAFWGALSQQQALQAPAQSAPAPSQTTLQPVSSMPMPAPKPATPDPLSLPRVNADLFPHAVAAGSQVLVLGSFTGPGGTFTGENVAGGVPVYAMQGGQWQQGFNANTLPVGTPLATLQSFAQYEVGPIVTEHLGS